MPANWVPPRRVAGASGALALAVMGDTLLYVALPLHAPALGLTAIEVGVLLSANRFIRMVTNRVAAWIMDRSARAAFVSTALLAAMTTLMYACATEFIPFLIARLLWGLSYSTMRLACFTTVLESSTRQCRGRVMGFHQSIATSGSFLAVMVGGALLATAGYESVFISVAACSVLAVPLALVSAPKAPTHVLAGLDEISGTTGSLPVGSAVSRQNAAEYPWGMGSVKWAVFSLSFVVQGVMMATLSLFLLEKLGPFVSGGLAISVVASWVIGCRWATEIGLAPWLGGFADRIGRPRAILIWLGIVVVAIGFLIAAPTLPTVISACLMLFIGSSGAKTTLNALASDLSEGPHHHKRMASYSDWADAGAALGPLVALVIAEQINLSFPYAVGAAMVATAVVTLIVRAPEFGENRRSCEAVAAVTN